MPVGLGQGLTFAHRSSFLKVTGSTRVPASATAKALTKTLLFALGIMVDKSAAPTAALRPLLAG
jgi:hypothetical protein